MFRTTVKDIVKIPGLDYVHVVGVNSEGNARIGDSVTDGEFRYEITSIPFVRRVIAKPVDEVDICIKPGDYNIDDLVGKVLYAE